MDAITPTEQLLKRIADSNDEILAALRGRSVGGDQPAAKRAAKKSANRREVDGR